MKEEENEFVMKNLSKFKLRDSFLEQYISKVPQWGPLGYVTYKRTYARNLESINSRHQKLAKKYGLKTSEEWWLTVCRVVEGVYQIQETWCKTNKLLWRSGKAHRSAEKMYDLIFNFRFLPPGRGLWMMGTDYVWERGSAALQNCGFFSTEHMNNDFSEPFKYLMDFSMVGVGVGLDTDGAGKVKIVEPKVSGEHVVSDTREGWVDLVCRVLDAYVGKGSIPEFIDYSLVRDEGESIRGFGGVSSGPQPLENCINDIKNILNARIGEKIKSIDIVDIANVIGKAVVAGNVRRTAEILFGYPQDIEFLELKDPNKNLEKLQSHRWASNNSVYSEIGQDYSDVANRTSINGEPGYFWLQNAREYSRLKDEKDYKDILAKGTNPCFSGKTMIAVADGRHAVSIKELAEKGEDVLVYSISCDNKIQKKWGRRPRKTRIDAEIIRVYLESGGYFDSTIDHNFILINKENKKAKDLKRGDVLFSFIKDKTEKIEQHNKNVVLKTEFLANKENVYNITVDDNYNFGIISDFYEERYNGVFVKNCGEQTLFGNGELCCLVETFPSLSCDLKEYKQALKFAYLYAKTVTIVPTHNAKTNTIVLKNRRIGTSMTGIVQAMNKFGRREFFNWCNEGYEYLEKLDEIYSNWLCIPKSIKTTSVKPSGTVSLLPGVTPGIHFPHSEYYYRVIRFNSFSPMVDVLRKNGYRCVDLSPNEPKTTAVYFPVKEEYFERSKKEVSMWEQLELAAQMQYYWADNQVSVTVTFNKEEASQIKHALELYETRLKGVSFLPLSDHGFKHAPYQEITKEEYENYRREITPVVNFENVVNEVVDKFCDGDSCEI